MTAAARHLFWNRKGRENLKAMRNLSIIVAVLTAMLSRAK